jgi:transposase-like protein
MDVHKNARTTPHSRALIAQRVAAGETPAAVARALGVCDRTVHKWVARAAEGPGRSRTAPAGRSARPGRSRRP